MIISILRHRFCPDKVIQQWQCKSKELTSIRKHTNTFICQLFHKSVRRWWSPLSGVDLQNVLSCLPYKIRSQKFKERVQCSTVSAHNHQYPQIWLYNPWVNFPISYSSTVSHLSVWQAKKELSVKASWSSQSWINGVQSVCSSYHNNLSSGI